ncbi:MAG TPA: divalent metal cation transporter FieF [Alphaproteobacteria bacterium]|nr:divalent metal cation transporter FieF [Alphaproteobacteria bacterium]HAJ45289.1 divalent metal cation transporter FieF [Alphaproteobacteria bacterium]
MTAPAITPSVSAATLEQVERLKRQATYAAVGVAGTLIIIKLAAWAITGSVSILASLVDSSLDLLASAINLMAVRHALEPADHEHRFGHGKAEAIAGMGQAAFIAGSGFFLAFESLTRLIRPEPITTGWLGIAVMIVSLALTLGLVWFQHRVLVQTRSLAIAADRFHYLTDIASNSAVLLALVLTLWLGWIWADAAGGLAIAIFVLWGAYKILRGSYDELMDREMADAERARIQDIVRSHPGVRSMHDLRTRRAGHKVFIQLHLDLPPDMTLLEAHVISDAVEAKLIAAFPGAEVLIHQDPEGIDEVKLDHAVGQG